MLDEQVRSAKATTQDDGLFAKSVLSIWLLIIFVALTSFVILSFSAYQFHISVKRLQDGNKNPVSISDIIAVQQKVYAIEDDISNKYEFMDGQNDTINSLRTKENRYEEDLRTVFDRCKAEVSALLSTEGTPGPEAGLIECGAKDMKLLAPASDPRKADLEALLARFAGNVESVKTNIKNVEDQISSAREGIETTNPKIEFLETRKRKIIDDSKIPSIQSYFAPTFFFQTSRLCIEGYCLIPDFTEMPTDALVLIIVVAMGALGGAIQVARNYLSAEDLNNIDTYRIRYRYIFFHPFLGAITALAIFILFKAGILVVSTPANSEDANINPFFVSFIGIISGMMATIALETIVRVGENWFKAGTLATKARWANRLEEALKAEADKEPKREPAAVESELVAMLGISAKMFGDWKTQKEPVPQSYQKPLALYFRRGERDLFTDIPKDANAGAI
ncbi:MAG: hypothetical protein JWL86_3296 [Rhizobium sp.]|nr:hypothetical protein [Rhizobium sp.]